jgi:hypothetical protein
MAPHSFFLSLSASFMKLLYIFLDIAHREPFPILPDIGMLSTLQRVPKVPNARFEQSIEPWIHLSLFALVL